MIPVLRLRCGLAQSPLTSHYPFVPSSPCDQFTLVGEISPAGTPMCQLGDYGATPANGKSRASSLVGTREKIICLKQARAVKSAITNSLLEELIFNLLLSFISLSTDTDTS